MALAAKSLLCLAFILHSSHALANDPSSNKNQHLVYEVYAGGIHAVQATLDITFDKKGRYDLVLGTQTRGFLGSIIPWKGTFESHGWIMDDDKFRPQHHQSTTGWNDEIDIKKYIYNKDGSFKSLHITDDHSNNELRDVASELTDQSTDALTATLQVLSDYNKTGKCEGSSEVFDGKRRFTQEFKHEKETTLSASKYNIFDGKSAQCIVEVTPIAGAWHKKPRGWLSIQEQGRERGLMPTVWIGKLSENGPAIPIKIRIKTAYGTLFMHLAEYKNAGKTLITEKRMDHTEE